jgi:hypothetical protein
MRVKLPSDSLGDERDDGEEVLKIARQERLHSPLPGLPCPGREGGDRSSEVACGGHSRDEKRDKGPPLSFTFDITAAENSTMWPFQKRTKAKPTADAWYDQGPLAVFFGLDPRFDEHMNVVYSYLGLMFFLAADHAGRAGLGRIESRGGRAYFVLTKEGRQKYPSPPDEEYLLEEWP